MIDKGRIRVNLTVPEEIYKEFREFCERNGFKMSTRMTILMKKDMEDDEIE